MEIIIFEQSIVKSNKLENWKELYNKLAKYGVVRSYNGKNVSESEYESFIRNKDIREYAYDKQKQENNILLQYLDSYIEIDLK